MLNRTIVVYYQFVMDVAYYLTIYWQIERYNEKINYLIDTLLRSSDEE